MARYNETIDTSSESIRGFADNLRTIAQSFEQQAELMELSKLDRLPVTHWKTARSSVAGLAAFAAAIQDAIVRAKVMNGIDKIIEDAPGKALKPKAKSPKEPR
jgi:hypothetical protein